MHYDDVLKENTVHTGGRDVRRRQRQRKNPKLLHILAKAAEKEGEGVICTVVLSNRVSSDPATQ
jgi:hypothetical protein